MIVTPVNGRVARLISSCFAGDGRNTVRLCRRFQSNSFRT